MILSEVKPSEECHCEHHANNSDERIRDFRLPTPVFVPKRRDAAHAVGTACRMIDSCVAERYCRRTLGQAAQEILTRVEAERLCLAGRNMLLMQPFDPRL